MSNAGGPFAKASWCLLVAAALAPIAAGCAKSAVVPRVDPAREAGADFVLGIPPRDAAAAEATGQDRADAADRNETLPPAGEERRFVGFFEHEMAGFRFDLPAFLAIIANARGWRFQSRDEMTVEGHIEISQGPHDCAFDTPLQPWQTNPNGVRHQENHTYNHWQLIFADVDRQVTIGFSRPDSHPPLHQGEKAAKLFISTFTWTKPKLPAVADTPPGVSDAGAGSDAGDACPQPTPCPPLPAELHEGTLVDHERGFFFEMPKGTGFFQQPPKREGAQFWDGDAKRAWGGFGIEPNQYLPACLLNAESPSYPSVLNSVGVRYALRPSLDFTGAGLAGWLLTIRGSDVTLLFNARPGYRGALEHIATTFRWDRPDAGGAGDASSDVGKVD